MKKKLFTILAATASLSLSAQSTFVINGTANQGMEGKTIYLFDTSNQLMKDSTVVTNGKYSFSGKVEKPVLAAIGIPQGKRFNSLATAFLENGTIQIENMVATGTPSNNNWKQYQESIKPFTVKMMSLENEAKQLGKDDTEKLESLKKQYMETYENMLNVTKEYIFNNLDNITPATLIARNERDLKQEDLDKIVNSASPVLKENAVFARFLKHYEGTKRAAVGAKFTDFKMKDLNDQEVALSDYVGKGKYVLVDFWASWCGPCRREIPAVKAAYEKFKDKGFEIVGVSFDNNKEAWAKAVKDLGISWPQMSDLQGWGTVAANIYGINGIPFTLLLDPNGVIIAKDLRGAEIEATLGKYLK